MSQQWFSIPGISDPLRVEFQKSPVRYWPPEVMQRAPLPENAFADRAVVLTGAGAVWMYAHAAAIAVSQGARSVDAVRASRQGERADAGAFTVCLTLDPTGTHGCLTIEMADVERVAHGPVLEEIARQLHSPRAGNLREMCITGLASVECYARASAMAVRRGVAVIYCLTPPDGLIVVFDSAGKENRCGSVIEMPVWLAPIVDMRRAGRIVGIIGDPNCGKSVFSFALQLVCRQANLPSWRYDCDGRAPTADWYLNLVRHDPQEAGDKRRQIKVEWTSELEDAIARRLAKLRPMFDIIVADLPGGDHSVSPPARIPPHREVIFLPIDVFVLVQRRDAPTETEWRRELRRLGLEDKLRLIINSHRPGDAPAFAISRRGDGRWIGEATGLDRSAERARLVNACRGPLMEFVRGIIA